MFKLSYRLITIINAIILVSAAQFWTNQAIAQTQQIPFEDLIVMPAPDIGDVCTLDPIAQDVFYYRSAEQMAAKLSSDVRSAEFEIDYINACEENTWPAEARNAFEYALDLWSSHLNSTVPIRVQASWVDLQCDDDGCVLGSAGPTLVFRDFGAGSEPGTFYTIAQASAMTGRDLVAESQGSANSTDYDITVNMNCNFPNWYFGTDANTPAGTIDFVTVNLHEIGHGIGFIGSMSVNNTTGSYGIGGNNLPLVYDLNAEDGNGVSLLNTSVYPNPSNALYQALTGQRDGVFHTGQDARNVYFAQPVPLYSPFEWRPGSSFSHLDQSTFNQTENALMRPRVEQAFAVHSPGPIFCGMLSDWGWPLGTNCLAFIGSEAFITVNQSALDFGVTNVGTTVTRQFTISNEELAEDPLSFNLSIENSNFEIFPSSAATQSLSPGESAIITIRYNPEMDAIHNANLRIAHNGSNQSSPILISLTGESLERDEIARLEQNYPNPFNPTTTIPYILPESSLVEMKVYSLGGQLVRTLVERQEQSEGRYEVILNGADLSSGIYLYRLVVNGFADTKKLIVIK